MHQRTSPVDISKHQLIKDAYELCRAIEECGASPELTNASSKASDLMTGIANHVEPMVDAAKRDEFKALCDPLIKWLCENFHPHVTVIVTHTTAELSSGESAYSTHAFLRD